MSPRVGEYFCIAGMIGVFNRYDALAERCVFLFQKRGEFLFGLGRPDNQYLVCTGERLGHFLEKLGIGRMLGIAVRALTAMHFLVLVVRMNDLVLFVG